MIKEETKGKKVDSRISISLLFIPLFSYLMLWSETKKKGIKKWEERRIHKIAKTKNIHTEIQHPLKYKSTHKDTYTASVLGVITVRFYRVNTEKKVFIGVSDTKPSLC